MAFYEVKQADTLSGLSVGVSGVTDLSGYECRLVVKDMVDRTVALLKELTAVGSSFPATLTPAETNSLDPGDYNLVFEVSNSVESYNMETWHNLKVLEDILENDDLVPEDPEYDFIHSHSNKAILDAITAAYTTAEASKLASIPADAADDQTKEEIDALGLSHDSLVDVSSDDHHNEIHSLDSHTARTIVNQTDLTLSVTNVHAGQAIDCYNAATQTLTFAALTSGDDALEWYFTKLGAGNVTIVAPASVTFAGGDSSITLVTAGYECKVRYNHTRLMLIISYDGEII